MMSDDPVADAIGALLTDEVEARVMAALAALAAGTAGVRKHAFVRGALTRVHSVLALYGSTAGPFGGIGGAAMTTFRMTVIFSPEMAILFSGGRLYGIAKTGDVDMDAMDARQFTRVPLPRPAARA